MITLRNAGYTIAQLSELSNILANGLTDLMGRKCIPDCSLCPYSYLCQDLESTIKFLNNQIEEAKRKFCVSDNT